eukprot:5070760-Lingulodinium_polyedra.AAC.1
MASALMASWARPLAHGSGPTKRPPMTQDGVEEALRPAKRRRPPGALGPSSAPGWRRVAHGCRSNSP